MTRVPVLDTSDKIDSRHLPALSSASITDFTEAVQDAIATAFASGTHTNLTVSYNDTSNTFSFAAAAGGTTGVTDPEIVRDTIATALVAGTNIAITPNDVGDTITISAASTTDPEVVRDTMAIALAAGTGIVITPNDTANTITVGTTGLVLEDEQVFNAKDHGCVGNNVVDDTAALNAVSDLVFAAGTGARLLIPRGIYKITGQVNFKCNLDASQATFVFTPTAGNSMNAISLGDAGAATNQRKMELPKLQKNSVVWNDATQGVVAYNLNDCQVWIPYVTSFEQGVRIQGQVTGNVYNTYYLGSILACHRGLILDANNSGWCNQNLFINGRIQASMWAPSLIAAGVLVQDDTTASMLELGVTALQFMPNNNTFINMSLEGDTPAYYRLKCNGSYNKFINCRWEINGGSADPGTNTSSRVLWGATARYNVIDGGYQASDLFESIVAGSVGNVIRGHRTAYINATNTSSAAIPSGGTTTYKTIGGWASDDIMGPYTAGTGKWTPRQGLWHFSCTLSVVTTSAGGDIVARLLADGTDIIDMDSAPVNVGGRVWMKLNASRYFDGVSSLEVQVLQDPTVARTLAGAAGFNSFHAEYLGG